MKNKAFTLAETLVVIGAIGIVAALTLPDLNKYTGHKETVAAVKKFYSEVVNAYNMAQLSYGPVKTWCIDLDENACNKKIGERISENLKLKKVCGIESSRACFSDTALQDLNGNFSYNTNDSNGYKVILQTGPSISFRIGCANRVDIDGPNKGPNVLGRDVFVFCTWNPQTNEYEFVPQTEPDLSVVNMSGSNAASWILKHGNMDYLVTDLVDSKRVKCVNSSVILDGMSKSSCK